MAAEIYEVNLKLDHTIIYLHKHHYLELVSIKPKINALCDDYIIAYKQDYQVIDELKQKLGEFQEIINKLKFDNFMGFRECIIEAIFSFQPQESCDNQIRENLKTIQDLEETLVTKEKLFLKLDENFSEQEVRFNDCIELQGFLNEFVEDPS